MQSLNMSKGTGRALDIAKQVLETEIEGIRSVMESLDERFDQCVDMLYALRGRVVVTGVGKSGIIGRKIAATMTSTGTPAIFVHPLEGLHGDLGIVTRDDALWAISNSGETPEITSLAATIKKRGALIIGITGVASSTLARMADLVLDCRVPREACPLNMAPTASTTAALALGDAVAVALMIRRDFRREDFLRHHPAGSLGERLNLQVKDIMCPRDVTPTVEVSASMDEVLKTINRVNLGVTLVLSEGRLVGIVTDGDVRRALLKKPNINGWRASEVMTRNPLTIGADRTAAEAMEMMARKQITALAVLNEEGELVGIVHLHDLLGRGTIRFT